MDFPRAFRAGVSCKLEGSASAPSSLVPILPHDLPLRQDLSGVFYKELQKCVFGGGQLHLFSFDPDETSNQINFQVAGTKDSGVLTRDGMAVRHPQSRQQFIGAEGLC